MGFKKLIIIAIVLLSAVPVLATVFRINQDGVYGSARGIFVFSKPADTASAISYWNTSMTDRWDTEMTALWDTTMDTEVP